MWEKALDYLKKGLLILGSTIVAALIIALIGRIRISRVVLFFSIFYMAIGGGVMIGNLGNIGGAPHKRSDRVIEEAVPDESPKEKRGEKNMRLALFIAILGVLIMAAGFVFDAFGM